MEPLNLKSSRGTQNKKSNAMGIGLGIDHETCRNIQIWIPPPHQIFMGGAK